MKTEDCVRGCAEGHEHYGSCSSGGAPTLAPLTSKDEVQGPLWTPTLVVERLMRQTQASTADQITMDRKQLEGLLFDVLRCRNNHSVGGAVPETRAEPAPYMAPYPCSCPEGSCWKQDKAPNQFCRAEKAPAPYQNPLCNCEGCRAVRASLKTSARHVLPGIDKPPQ